METRVSVRAAVDVKWGERLASAGADVLALLGESALAGLPGQVEVLAKPGLRGRSRARWRLADGETLFFKRYGKPTWREQWDRIRRQRAGRSRAWWEYHASGELLRVGIPAACAVGFAEDMSGPLERASAVLFERAPGEAVDRAWIALLRERSPLCAGLPRHDLARRLGRFVSAFHQTGYTHRDLYLCHIFVDLDASGAAPPRFTLIDLARLHRPRWRRTRWTIKDLAQLDSSARRIGASRSDRLRFLLAYLGLERGAARTRWYARRIVRKSSAILWRDVRRGRCA